MFCWSFFSVLYILDGLQVIQLAYEQRSHVQVKALRRCARQFILFDISVPLLWWGHNVVAVGLSAGEEMVSADMLGMSLLFRFFLTIERARLARMRIRFSWLNPWMFPAKHSHRAMALGWPDLIFCTCFKEKPFSGRIFHWVTSVLQIYDTKQNRWGEPWTANKCFNRIVITREMFRSLKEQAWVSAAGEEEELLGSEKRVCWPSRRLKMSLKTSQIFIFWLCVH